MLDKHIAPDNFGIMPYIDIFGIHISTYTIFMLLAVIFAFIAYKLTKTKMDDTDKSSRALIIIFALLGGIIGAKLPILIFNYDLLFQYPANINLIFSGKTIIGGLIGGYFSVRILKKRLNINLKVGNDIAAPAALGMAIGRLGCFFRGCCYGIEAPQCLGIDFHDGIYRYPTQLYELVFDFVLFIFLLYIKKKKEPKPGVLFRYLLNYYLTFRFFIEFIRESDRIIYFISYYQIICLICLIVINKDIIIKFIKHFCRKEEREK